MNEPSTRERTKRLVEEILEGNRRAASRMMRQVDDRTEGHLQALDTLFAHTGRAHVIGVAGSPGCGKSTLVDGLIAVHRSRGKTVGVVAVDPSSSLSGGAILGDRIRMQRHFEDVGVFIRSVATRGNVGGLSSSTQDIARIMDAMGMDVVLIETVGVGQDEVEIASVADTVAVVLSPDTGDAVQIMKAGIMEVGDVFVVNKADRPGADLVARELSLFFQLHQVSTPPAVVETVAIHQEGLDALADALASHREGSTRIDRRERLKSELMRRFAESVVSRLTEKYADSVETHLDAIEKADATPYAAVKKLIDHFGSD